MIFQTQEILFFSLNDKLSDSFESYVRLTKKEFQEHSIFQLIRSSNGSTKHFAHLQELFFFLDELELIRLANLILIIDIYSFDPKNEKGNTRLLQEAVVKYPEVKITFFSFNQDWTNYFDTSELNCNFNKSKCPVWASCKKKNMEFSCKPACSIKIPYIHSFDPFENDAFSLLIRGKSNLFDASNLRNVIKQDFYKKIHVQANYPRCQCSRLNHLALAVEEEIPLAYFNGYSLYANGYRSMPITSYIEIEKLAIVENEENKILGNDCGLDLIIRDYDLQFEDYGNNEKTLFALRGLEKRYKYKEDVDLVNNIQKDLRELIVSDEAKTMIEDLGKFVTLKEYYKFYIKMKKEKQNTSTYGPIISILSQIEAYWFQEDRIWKNIINSNSKIHTYFVTRFDENKTKKTPYLDNLYFKVNIAESTTGIVIKKSNEYAVLKGIIKPISGIYALHEIKEIKVVYEAAQESRSVISTERDGSGGHSVSPFTFHIADNLIKRSQKYYDAKLFMLSALLAKEAYEILNGFHLMMALQSIYLRAIAETSLVTNTLGVEEDRIAKNISLIISDVRSHVDRICVGNVNAKKNILTQVFNDIRHICRNKEQFKAADIALAELINTRFGSSLWK